MPLIFDRSGRMRPPGATERLMFDESFVGGAIPSVLTGVATGGTTAVTASAGVNRLTLTTAATSGQTAMIKTAADYSNTAYKATYVEASRVTLDSGTGGIEVGFEGDQSGQSAKIRQDSGNSDIAVKAILGTLTTDLPLADIRTGSEFSRAKTLGIMFLRREKEMYFFLNGALYGYAQSSTFNGGAGNVHPFVRITARQGTALNAQIYRFRAIGWF